MQKTILDALERLITPGSQTSEGKNATRITWSFLLVIGAALASSYCGINPTGSAAIVVSAILGLLWNSTIYTNARTNVKECVAQILANPAAQAVMKEMGIPSAQPFKLGDFQLPAPIKPEPIPAPINANQVNPVPEPLTLKEAVKTKPQKLSRKATSHSSAKPRK